MTPEVTNTDQYAMMVDEILLDADRVSEGDKVVIVAGSPPGIPGSTNAVRVPYGGRETEHQGRFDLLPFDPASMELVRAEGGRIPNGRRPVEGGYEEGGARLFHALATLHEHGGVKVPGKCGEHLVRIRVSYLSEGRTN